MKKSASLLFKMTKLGFIKAIKLVFFVILSTVGYCQWINYINVWV